MMNAATAPDAAAEAVDLALQIGQHPLAGFSISLALLLMLTIVLWWLAGRHLAGARDTAGRLRLRALGGGMAVALAAGALFLVIAQQIGRDGVLSRFDAALAQTLSLSLSPRATAFFAQLTHAGDTLTFTVVTIALALLLVWRRQHALALLWVVAIGGNAILNVSLKAQFARARPLFDETVISAAGWSFPCGHSSGTAVMCGMFAFLAQRLLAPHWRLPALLAAVALAWSVGVSRVLLRVHYFSDVLGGLCSGLAWLTLCVLVWHLVRRVLLAAAR